MTNYKISKAMFTILFALTVAVGSAFAAVQIDIPAPANSGDEFDNFFILPNGNIVIADYAFDTTGGGLRGGQSRGAVYLHNGATGALISTITGSTPSDGVGQDIRILLSGDFLIRSPNWDGGKRGGDVLQGDNRLFWDSVGI